LRCGCDRRACIEYPEYCVFVVAQVDYTEIDGLDAASPILKFWNADLSKIAMWPFPQYIEIDAISLIPAVHRFDRK